ncbi:hypothetical protein [uncultured Tyzzerella sp.]|uniref:hypothetical protein n=1 Tax=uncultured Tyzzerella sp. TaxID=2321398 RepID=UPI002941DA03|nr:hypothetical protein [uncultured Tyzzerella sp.]
MTNDTNYKVCSGCGSLVDNVFNVKANELCKTCVEKKLEEKENISPLGTFMCSLIPGVGQIFLGKKQKGLFLLTSFILNLFLFLLSFFLIEIFFYFYPFQFIFSLVAIICVILDCLIYLYSLFDSNISRKYIENNNYIDGFVDKLSYKFLKFKNKKALKEKIIDKRLQ